MSNLSRRWLGGFAVLLVTISLASGCACASDYGDAEMQPLAATAQDLARAVRLYAREHRDAASLDEIELVRRATAHDPAMLEPYGDLVVRARTAGIVLVCSEDGSRGLFEDAACSTEVDGIHWHDRAWPCEFAIDLATVCPR